jgi:serine/threonine-protein kinase RsbW
MCDLAAFKNCPETGCHSLPEKTVSLSLDREAETSLSEVGKVWAGTATVRTTGDIEAVLDILLDALKQNGFTRQEIFGIHLSLTEALVNAVKHGHRGDPGKQVRLRYLINYVGLLAQVEDEGPGFVQSKVLDPREPENLDKDCGRGLLLMLCYMTEVRYNAAGNCVTLVKRRRALNVPSAE